MFFIFLYLIQSQIQFFYIYRILTQRTTTFNKLINNALYELYTYFYTERCGSKS